VPDNIPIVGAGSGQLVGSETKTINAVPVQVQETANALGGRDLYVGTQGGRGVDGAADTAAAYVDPRILAKKLTANPTVSTSAFVAGYCVGGLLAFTNAARASGGSLLVASAVLQDESKQNAVIDLILFDDNPSASTFTDHVALDILAADLPLVAGCISFPAAAYTFATTSIQSVSNIGIEVALVGTSLYGVMVVHGTPTWAAADDLSVKLVVIQD